MTNPSPEWDANFEVVRKGYPVCASCGCADDNVQKMQTTSGMRVQNHGHTIECISALKKRVAELEGKFNSQIEWALKVTAGEDEL
jgi:hypothetical protein